jgi:molecular chaperone GrpE
MGMNTDKESREKMTEPEIEGSGATQNVPTDDVQAAETPDTLTSRVRELQEEKDQLFARLQRAMADLQNYQKRAIKERQEAVQRAEINAIERFVLPLIDDLDRAMKAAVEHGYSKDDPLFHGVNLVLQHAFGQLKQLNIEPIEAEGKPFDPLFHEAIMELPGGEHPENQVVQVVARGYTQDSKTIRPARVVIAKPAKPAGNDAQPTEPDGEFSKQDKE